MNKPLLLTLAISSILLSACQDLPITALAGAAGVSLPAAGGANATPAQQEVWVDGQGFQANPQDLSACNISAQVTTQQERKALGEHKSLVNILKDTVQDSMEQDNQLKTCMQGKNYVKVKAEPGKMPPQRVQNNFNNGNPYPASNPYPANPYPNTFNNGNPYPANTQYQGNPYPANTQYQGNPYPANTQYQGNPYPANTQYQGNPYPANTQYQGNPYPANTQYQGNPYPANTQYPGNPYPPTTATNAAPYPNSQTPR